MSENDVDVDIIAVTICFDKQTTFSIKPYL